MKYINCTLITGACGGLGRAFVKILAEKKENLVLTGTSQEKLDKLLEDFKDDFQGLFVKSIVCDLAIKNQRESLIQDLKDSKLVVNKLINNAGVIIEGDVLRFSNEELEKLHLSRQKLTTIMRHLADEEIIIIDNGKILLR